MRLLRLSILIPLLALPACDSGPGPNTSPQVDFSFAPQNPRAGTAVDFTADATDPDGEIKSFRWDFGDGEQANGPNPTHTFDQKGLFDVRLSVTDDREETVSTTKTVDIQQRFTRATITEVQIREMPFTNDDGVSWDLTSGPDIYYDARNPDGEQLERSSTIDNVAPEDLPITPTGEFTMEELSGGAYTIFLLDEDPTNADDNIDFVSFNLEDQIGAYPDSRTASTPDGEMTVRLSLDWKN